MTTTMFGEDLLRGLGLDGMFRAMDYAEEEITKAKRRHRGKANVLYHSFRLLGTHSRVDFGTSIYTEFIFRSHCRELLDRAATGGETRLPTAAEIVLACSGVSGIVPMHGAASGLYLRTWAQAFPDHPQTADNEIALKDHESLYGQQIDDLAVWTKRKLIDPKRMLKDETCPGRHHGRKVRCEFTG